MFVTNSPWVIPESEPAPIFDVTLARRRDPVRPPVIVPRAHGEPLVVMPVREGDSHRLLALSLLSGELRFDVALGDAAHLAGPVVVEEEGTLLASYCDRRGLTVYVSRLDRQGRELERDSFERPYFEDNSFPVFESTIERLEALPGGAYALSWFEEDEPYDVGHTVRVPTPERKNSRGWIQRGDIKARIGDVLVGHRVVRLDRVAWYRPIVGRRLADGAELWTRAPHGRDYEYIFEAFGGVLLVNDERRRIAQMPTGARGPADTPAFVTLLDAASGALRWQSTIDGFIASVCVGQEAVAMVVSNHDGQGRLAWLDAEGQLRFSAPALSAPPNKQRYGAPPPTDWPRLVSFDGRRVVWHFRGALRCSLANDTSAECWRLALDEPHVNPLLRPHPETLLYQAGRRLVAL
jgi:hypothetical protein